MFDQRCIASRHQRWPSFLQPHGWHTAGLQCLSYDSQHDDAGCGYEIFAIFFDQAKVFRIFLIGKFTQTQSVQGVQFSNLQRVGSHQIAHKETLKELFVLYYVVVVLYFDNHGVLV